MEKKINKVVKCVDCGREYMVAYYEKDYQKWQDGELIQRAMPYLSPSFRELLKTGICKVCWQKFKIADEK